MQRHYRSPAGVDTIDTVSTVKKTSLSLSTVYGRVPVTTAESSRELNRPVCLVVKS